MSSNATIDAVCNTTSLCMQQNCNGQSSTYTKNWDIPKIIMPHLKTAFKYAVLILNRPIMHNYGFMVDMWNQATIRMTVDGGTKQWDRYLTGMSEETQEMLKLPDLITGDFDSITEDILEKYKKKGCKAIHTPNQNYTDFTKALMELNDHCQEIGTQLGHVLVFAQSSGRIDQALGNIQTLFLVKDKCLLNPNTNVYIMSDDSLSWLLYPGEHEILVPECTRKHKKAWCSLVPIGEPCQYVTTTGLKWNLNNESLKFGELVSTSNTFDGSETVTVRCSHTLLWSMRIPNVINL